MIEKSIIRRYKDKKDYTFYRNKYVFNHVWTACCSGRVTMQTIRLYKNDQWVQETHVCTKCSSCGRFMTSYYPNRDAQRVVLKYVKLDV